MRKTSTVDSMDRRSLLKMLPVAATIDHVGHSEACGLFATETSVGQCDYGLA